MPRRTRTPADPKVAGNASLRASGVHSVSGLPQACHDQPRPRGSLGLADALRALADAGLPPESLAATIEALMRAARPTPA